MGTVMLPSLDGLGPVWMLLEPRWGIVPTSGCVSERRLRAIRSVDALRFVVLTHDDPHHPLRPWSRRFDSRRRLP
jgi:hypothetical protein